MGFPLYQPFPEEDSSVATTFVDTGVTATTHVERRSSPAISLLLVWMSVLTMLVLAGFAGLVLASSVLLLLAL